ncbi:MAG: TetR/AcrR family transcriptional regulator [Pseudoflavonifractor sp.]
MARYTGLDPQKTDRIRNAAIALFFEQGVEKTTIAQIAQRAEIAKGTIYLYYTSRDALLEDVFWYCHARHAGAADRGLDLLPTACDKLKQRVENSIRWQLCHPEEAYVQGRYYIAHPFSNEGQTPLVLHYTSQRQIIEAGVAAGEFKDLPVPLLGELINSTASGVIAYMTRYPEMLENRAILDLALEAIVAGLRAKV